MHKKISLWNWLYTTSTLSVGKMKELYRCVSLQILPGDGLPQSFPCAECISVEIDQSTSYPLIDVGKNSFNTDKEDSQNCPNSVEWGGKLSTFISHCLDIYCDVFVSQWKLLSVITTSLGILALPFYLTTLFIGSVLYHLEKKVSYLL